ncbi:S8 family serine peptidase [bacterium]|nr:S8 family serine peptidase [bacterium]
MSYSKLIIILLLAILTGLAAGQTEPDNLVIYDQGKEIVLFRNPLKKVISFEPPDDPGEILKVWVFFTDKGIFSEREYLDKKVKSWEYISEQARLRRRRTENGTLDFYDFPVIPEYISRIESLGARHRCTSRWLNGASFQIPVSVLPGIRELPFVHEIRPLTTRRARLPLSSDSRSIYKSKDEDPFYGFSLPHLNSLGVPPAHQPPYNLKGQGVRIGVFDTGFWLPHNAFDSLRVIYAWDFIQGDSVVENQEGEPQHQHSHGTNVLSSLGGFLPGAIVGPAYLADYYLFKTESVAAETVWQEEDRYIKALEVAESLGVDIVSTSLGYSISDDDSGYSYQDMDGNTALTTIAADIAASRNVLVITASGNERNSSWHYLIAPSDGDSVMGVGALNNDGGYAYFSSPGPTADGRIKPNLTAPGIAVYCASPAGSREIETNNGTSMATPLLAGTAALVLQASFDHDTLTAMALLETLQITADQYYDPDNDYGWGRPHAMAASGLWGALYGQVTDSLSHLPLNDVLIIYHNQDTSGIIHTDQRGRFILATPYAGDYDFVFDLPGYVPDTQKVSLEGTQKILIHPAMCDTSMVRDSTIVVDRIQDHKIYIFPNPFSDSLTVGVYQDSCDTIFDDHLSLFIWNTAGELIFEKNVDLNLNNPYIWNSQNTSGKYLGNGIYIVSAQYRGYHREEKIALIKN